MIVVLLVPVTNGFAYYCLAMGLPQQQCIGFSLPFPPAGALVISTSHPHCGSGHLWTAFFVCMMDVLLVSE
jgi:hypothetical protein